MPIAVRCIDCGRPKPESPCADCKRKRNKARAKKSFYQTPEWRRQRAQARRDQGDECIFCGSTERPVTHHKTGRKEGGKDVQSNFVILCGAGAIGVPWRSCHSQYEADKRAGRDTELRRFVEAL